jgi:hypothetical protein
MTRFPTAGSTVPRYIRSNRRARHSSLSRSHPISCPFNSSGEKWTIFRERVENGEVTSHGRTYIQKTEKLTGVPTGPTNFFKKERSAHLRRGPSAVDKL